MRVLIVHSGSFNQHPSGEMQVALLESKWLEKSGVEVELYIAQAPQQSFPFWISGVIAAFENIWSRSAAKHLAKKIADFSPDIIHFHGLIPFLSASALKQAHRSGVAVVQTLHNGRWLCLEGGFYRKGRYCDQCVGTSGWLGVVHGCNRGVFASTLFFLANMAGRFRGRLFTWVDRFIAVSSFIEKQYVLGGFPEDKVVVKSNTVDLRTHKDQRLAYSRRGVAFVGRVSESKGAKLLEKLIPLIDQEVHVVGDGPDLDSVKQYCHDASHKHVKFWGKQPQEQCFSIMSSMVCTVVPSQCGESFSLVAAESMGLGTPVIGSNLGGLGGLLRESGGGIVVEAGSPQGFADAIRELHTSPQLFSELSERGRLYVEQQLGVQKNVQQLIDLYKEVLEEKGLNADHI